MPTESTENVYYNDALAVSVSMHSKYDFIVSILICSSVYKNVLKSRCVYLKSKMTGQIHNITLSKLNETNTSGENCQIGKKIKEKTSLFFIPF